jgi:PKD repeat protein
VWIGVSPVDGAIYWMHYGFGSGQRPGLPNTAPLPHPPPNTTATPPPTASPTSGPAPLTVTFAASATDLDGDAVSYHWDFGDGTSAASANPSKTYASPGVYTAQLTVTANGDTVTGAPVPIQVGQPPAAAITAPPRRSPPSGPATPS